MLLANGRCAALVDARLDLGDVAGARAAADELSRLASTARIRLLTAHADLAAAHMALAARPPAAAFDRTLVIGERTAGHHVSHIPDELGVRDRAEAAAYAARAVRE